MEKLNLNNTDVKVVTEALNAVKDLEPGDYEFNTNVGTCMVRKGDTRRIIYRDGKMITPKALRDLLREAPEPTKSDDAPTGGLLSVEQLDKKYKRKKIIKVLPESGVLKKKKLAKAIEGFEKLAEKKMTGHEILACLAEVKKGIKAEKLVALFDLL